MAALPVAGRLPAAAGHRAAVVDCSDSVGGGMAGYTLCVKQQTRVCFPIEDSGT